MITEQYANHHGWSDIDPYEIVRVISDKTIEIRPMKAERDESVKLEWVVGGFAGHCTNQRAQKWHITRDEQAPVIRARLHKDGAYHSKCGKHYLSDKPIRFYDYNF
jgi:hypothetical protein